MATLMTPIAEKNRGYDSATGKTGTTLGRSIEWQGDAGWGVQSEARFNRQEKARKNARNAALPPVLR